ncbi:hypothetical protein [Streptomyces sp. NPDC048508]|uniref:hypothetical protein n=1 Tax=Streptomyces sp. NPDC048508 TaxID=3365561 RepID=UPI003715E928
MNDGAVEKASSTGTDVLVGYCYTRARRHPLVIGRFPGGGQMWGGPYTIPQAIVIAGTFTVLLMFRPIWAHFGLLLNVAIAVGVPYTLGMVVKRINVDGRNPLAVASSVVSLMANPSTGRMRGRPLKDLTRRPLRAVCTVTWQADPVAARPARSIARAQKHPKPPMTDGPVGERPQGSNAQGPLGPNSGPTQQKPQVLSAASALLAARNTTTRPKED